jgi:hypothetical protein
MPYQASAIQIRRADIRTRAGSPDRVERDVVAICSITA